MDEAQSKVEELFNSDPTARIYKVVFKNEDGTTSWSLNEGNTSWYYYSMESKTVTEDFNSIDKMIHCEKSEPRALEYDQATLSDILKKIKSHIINGYYKASQVPVQDEEGNSLNPVLLSWMEVN